MLFGSVENVFEAFVSVVEAVGGSLGTVLGTGTGSGAGLLSNVFEAIYAGSGAEIEGVL
jgi:hypothetical protein